MGTLEEDLDQLVERKLNNPLVLVEDQNGGRKKRLLKEFKTRC